MNNTTDVSEQQTTEPCKNKKNVKKTVLISVSVVLVLCLVTIPLAWISYLNNNPLSEIALAALKTFKSSAKAEITVSRVVSGEESESFYEMAVVNKDENLGISVIGDGGMMFYLDKEYVFSSKPDGSVSLTHHNEECDEEEEEEETTPWMDKSVVKDAVWFLNEKVFKDDVLEPDETEKRVKKIADYYFKKEYLEENLGFSSRKENGEKVFSFRFEVTEILSVLCDIVYNSENVFNERETYEKVMSVLKIAANLDIDSEIELDIRTKNGYISAIEFVNRSFDGEKEKGFVRYELVFSDYGKTEHDETVIAEFSEYKDVLGEFKSYELAPDGSCVFTDKDGKKHKYLSDSTTTCFAFKEKGIKYA